jgi:DNA-binding transcriptional ArsR family regulator
MSITKLADGADVTRQAIAKHLRVMEDAGLVRGSKQGRESLWELEPDRLEDARRVLDAISRHWDAALGRLKRLVEED